MSLNKRIRLLLLSLVFTVFTFSSIATTFGDTPEQNNTIYKTGAKSPTEEQLEATDKRLLKPIIIYKNKISKKRYKTHPDPNEYIAPFGEEIVGSAITDSSSDQEGTTSTNLASTYIGTTQETNDANLPDSVDNTTDSVTAPYFPGIGDQGFEGSCCCFSTTYYVLTSADCHRSVSVRRKHWRRRPPLRR